jgi:hypothetical protein
MKLKSRIVAIAFSIVAPVIMAGTAAARSNPAGKCTQMTNGDNSPAIANVEGNVTINGKTVTAPVSGPCRPGANIEQRTQGSNSPAISGVTGDVTITNTKPPQPK